MQKATSETQTVAFKAGTLILSCHWKATLKEDGVINSWLVLRDVNAESLNFGIEFPDNSILNVRTGCVIERPAFFKIDFALYNGKLKRLRHFFL